MLNSFHTECIQQHPSLAARVMRLTTPHGQILTPAFMPVGTRAMLNYLTPTDLQQCGSQIILGGNTYHMLCTPGLAVIEKVGGMHHFMGWHQPMLTDSGGFQVWSLSQRNRWCKLDERGATFIDPVRSQTIRLDPETSIHAQKIIGADIIMAFDQCTPEQGGRPVMLDALERTHRWLIQSKIAHEKQLCSAYGHAQALFGIIQGGSLRDLRERSATFVVQQATDGIAIGGAVIGFDMLKTCEIIDWIYPLLPPQKVRYTMGVGLHPQDLLNVIAKGIDLFDCVAPTRNARHGALYVGEIIPENGWLRFVSPYPSGRLLIKKSNYAMDPRPIMEHCDCYTCQHFSRAYLHYLFKAKLIAYFHLASIHNVHLMHQVCTHARQLILRTSIHSID